MIVPRSVSGSMGLVCFLLEELNNFLLNNYFESDGKLAYVRVCLHKVGFVESLF